MAEYKLARLYALSLLEFAGRHELSEVYRQVSALILSGEIKAENAESDGLRKTLEQIPPDELEDALLQFISLARARMDRYPVEIISAVPLSREQQYKLELRLIQMLRKQLDISNTVDPDLLGGLRIIIDNTVIDHSVKRQLQDMKQAVYKGVFLHDGAAT
jgi:F0F1-type ATP synthase delta subunit